MSEIKHDNVYQAMAAAMAETGYVQKGGRVDSSSGGYRFAGEADVIEEIRPVMVKHGLFIYPSAVTELRTEQFTTRNGAVMNLAMVIQEYRLAHESGTELTLQTVGAGADTGDKAIPKANTGAFKYALRQAFTIETGDDPDKDSSEHQEREHRGNTPPPPQTRQQRPPAASQGQSGVHIPSLFEGLNERGLRLNAVADVIGVPLAKGTGDRPWAGVAKAIEDWATAQSWPGDPLEALWMAIDGPEAER